MHATHSPLGLECPVDVVNTKCHVLDASGVEELISTGSSNRISLRQSFTWPDFLLAYHDDQSVASVAERGESIGRDDGGACLECGWSGKPTVSRSFMALAIRPSDATSLRRDTTRRPCGSCSSPPPHTLRSLSSDES